MLRSPVPKRPLSSTSPSLLYPGRHASRPSSAFRRNASNSAGSNASANLNRPRSRVPVVLGALAGGAAAYYFFWPSASQHAPTLANAALSPSHFTPVKVAATESCADGDTRLITLEVPEGAMPPPEAVQDPHAGFVPIWSVFIKDDDIQVERPYTPLEGIDGQGRMRFWIKRYESGEVARWIHGKRVGEDVEVRGPVRTWTWREGAWDEVVMISGGTGITPFYQLLHQKLLAHPQDDSVDGGTSTRTRFTLLQSSRTPGELPPPAILNPLVSYANEHPDRLRLSLFVDKLDGTKAAAAPMNSIQAGRIGKVAVRRALGYGNDGAWWRKLLPERLLPAEPTPPAGKRILVLVCGPEPMINAIAGPYGRNYSQGPVGGVLGELGCRSDQVWKL